MKQQVKGQMNQVFIYIMAILVIGLLILMGFFFIDDILGKQCDIKEADFTTKISSSLDEARRYGAEKNIDLNVPCSSETLCFINASKLGDVDFEHPNPAIQTSVQENIRINIYLIDTSGDAAPVGYDERILVKEETGYFCVEESNNQFSYSVKGLGIEGVWVR